MAETSISEINVSELMAKTREEVAQLETKGDPPIIGTSVTGIPSASMTSNPLSTDDLPPLTPIAISQLSLQPEFQPKSNDQYHINDLLRYHDGQFVQNTFRAILKRMPDAEEYRYYIESLRSGRLNKVDILARLRFSAEGRAKKVKIKGLMLPTRVRQVGRLPILGYFVRLISVLVHLPIVIRNQQQFEAYSLALDQQIADHINRVSAQLDRINKEAVRGLGQGQGDVRRQLGLLGAHLKGAEREWEQRTKDLEKSIRELQGHMGESIQELREHVERRGAERDERMDRVEESVRGLGQGQGDVRRQLGLLGAHLKEVERGLEQRTRGLEESIRELQGQVEIRVSNLQEQIRETDAGQGELRQQAGLLEVRWKTLEERQRQEEALREQRLVHLQQELKQRDERLAREQEERERLQQKLEGLSQRHVKLFRHYEELRQENLLQKRRLDLILTELRQKAGMDERSVRTITAEGERLLDHTYFLFENRFRGAQEEIRKRQEIYLPVFRDALHSGSPLLRDNGFVLDLGCGRGEMLEALREAGISARGVDINEDMVWACRQKGLDVVREDLFVYLRSLADESLAGAISCQVIEHLTVEQNIELLRLLYDKLRWGALLVLETVNPENLLVSACNFHIDLSHRLKIPAISLAFLAEALGFAVVETRYLSPFPPEHHFRLPDRDSGDPHLQPVSENFRRLNDLFFGPQDYALICRK